MKKKKLTAILLCLVCMITWIKPNEIYIIAGEKAVEKIEVSYLLEEWVDCNLPIDKNYISILVYYKDGTMIQKQGVGTVYPYTLKPGEQTKIQVEYQGATDWFYVWGMEDSFCGSEPVITSTVVASSESNPTTTSAIIATTSAIITFPKPDPTTTCTVAESDKTEAMTASTLASMVTDRPANTPLPSSKNHIPKTYSVQLVSSNQGIYLTKKQNKKYGVFGKDNNVFTFGTSNIQKIEYQFVKKGKKKAKKWNVMKHNQVTLKNQGMYVLYLRFTTLAGKKVLRNTNGFVLDKSKPAIYGAEDKKVYQKKVTISFSDKLSGIKSAAINGKKLKNKSTIKKNGTYKIEVTDKAENKQSLSFTINIPTPTPKATKTPAPKPTIPPTSEPAPKPTSPPYVPVEKITAPSSITVKKGKTKRISCQVMPSNATNKKVTFTSTNKGVVTVSGDGTVRGKAEGMASVVIRSRSDSTKYATCVIFVQK